MFPDCEIYAFEPSESAYRKLAATAGVDPKTRPFHLALGERNVPLVRLAMFCARERIFRIDILKIDTRGCERKIIKGAGGPDDGPVSVLGKYLQGAGVLTAQAVVQRLLGALTSIVLARGLGTTGFGAYSAVINTVSCAYGMVRLGVDAAIHVYTARGKQDAEFVCLTGELLGAGLCILATGGFVAAATLAVSSEWLAVVVFGQPDLTGPLKFAGVLTALQCLSQFSYAALAGFQKFSAYARLMILNAVLTLALSAGGMWIYGLGGALGGYGIAQAILAMSLGGAATRAMREQGVRIAYSRLSRAFASLMRLGGPFYLSGLVAVPVIFYLQGLLSRSAGIDALGLLRVIGTITAVVAFVPGSVAAVTTSTLTRVRAEQGASSSKVFDYAFLQLKVIWYLTTVMAMTLAVLTSVLIETLFGAEYEAAIEPGTVALFSTAVASTAAAAGSLLFAVQRSGVIFWQSLWQSLVLAGGGLLLIPTAGVLGYVGAELAGNLMGLVFILFAVIRLAGRGWRDSRLAQAFTLCAFACLSSIVAIVQLSAVSTRILALLLIVLCMTFGVLWFGLSAWEQSVVRRVTLRFRARKG